MEPGKLANNTAKLISSEPVVFGSSKLSKIDVGSVPSYPVFLPYQTAWLTDKNPISVTEKSRQIGWSFIHAFRAVFKASSNKRDTLVTSYNKSSVKVFIKDCTFWARLFNTIHTITTNQEIIKDRFISIFELRFSNGRIIRAVSGDSVNMRGISGWDIIIDEAAYRAQPLDDILASASANIIHGGTIRIGSTHCGEDSDFNKLVQDIKNYKKPYQLHKTTFKEAITEGLYKRICLKKGETWTFEKELIWMESIYSMYGHRAIEELDAVPSNFDNEGDIFGKIKIAEIDHSRYWEYAYFRYHDLASTEQDKDNPNPNAFYSAGVKCAVHKTTGLIILVEYYAEQVNARDGDKLIIETSVNDTNDCTQILELEPGSTGQKWHDYMVETLAENDIYNVTNYAPKLKKLQRLIPAANAVSQGKIKRLKSYEMDELEKLLMKASSKKKPLISDLGDCVSGLFDFLSNSYYWKD